MKFIHSADIHLDSPMRGLEQYPGAPVMEMRNASRRAFEALVDLALSEPVAFVLIAGDLYDGEWRDYKTGLFFVAQMTRLREAGIPVLIAHGNHDAQNQMTKRLSLPDNVYTFPTRQPASHNLDGYEVVVHGQSYQNRAVNDNLAAAFPPTVRGAFNIGLLHTSLNGRAPHEPYAPCSVDDLKGKGYQYWALGHVHVQEFVAKDPWIVFPGNIQGRHARETGPKGCLMVTVLDGVVKQVETCYLDVARWSVQPVDTSGSANAMEVVDRVRETVQTLVNSDTGRIHAVRIKIQGSCEAHRELASGWDRWLEEIRGAVTDATGGRAWVERVELESRSPQTEVDAEDREEMASVLDSIAKAASDPKVLESLGNQMDDLWQKLPPELRDNTEEQPLRSPAGLASAADRAKHLIYERLLRKESAQ